MPDEPRRYLVVVQAEQGYAAPDAPLEPAPPDGPAPPCIHQAVLVADYERVVAERDALAGARFDGFTVGELQALVLAFSTAGAYNPEPSGPWAHPVWAAVAREASATLDRAARDEAWDERRGPSASGGEPS